MLPFVLNRGRIFTFHDLRAPTGPFRSLIKPDTVVVTPASAQPELGTLPCAAPDRGVARRLATGGHHDRCASGGLVDLRHARFTAEYRPEKVRVDPDPGPVVEEVHGHVILNNVLDPPVRRAAGALTAEHRHLVGELVADEREGRVVEVGEIQLVRQRPAGTGGPAASTGS